MGINYFRKHFKRKEYIYSFRFSKKYRATAYRDNNYLVMLALFVDHDSAYK